MGFSYPGFGDKPINIKEKDLDETADERVDVRLIVRGSPASPGVVEGPATVITDHRDFIKVKAGAILVCPFATQALTTLFSIIKGLVTDTGGVLSPAATITRERGIPAVVGTSVATETINEGDIIRIDGTKGRVEIISKAK